MDQPILGCWLKLLKGLVQGPCSTRAHRADLPAVMRTVTQTMFQAVDPEMSLSDLCEELSANMGVPAEALSRFRQRLIGSVDSYMLDRWIAICWIGG